MYPTGNESLLIVDDEPSIIRAIQQQLRHERYTIYYANSGKAGLEILKERDIGVVLSDYMMPEMDGLTFLELVKQHNPNVVRVLMTAYASMNNAINAINRTKIFEYLTKPWSAETIKKTIEDAFQHYNLVMENKRLQRLTKEQNQRLNYVNENLETLVRTRTSQLEEAIREGIFMLAVAAEAKDDNTGEHLHRIQFMTYEICSGLGMPADESKEISFFSIMHDVGKIHIPDRILKKQGPLSEDENAIMRTHCVAGEKILGDKPFYKTAREIARSHHERWDGKGYPDGLKGENIPLSARIVSIADVFDALINERPYKDPWPVADALNEMMSLSGSAFDPEILNSFLKTQAAKYKIDEKIWERQDGTEKHSYHLACG